MKKKFILIVILLIFIIFFFFGKINVNSLIKKPVINELKKITGSDISIEKIYLNLIPLYFEIRNIEVNDEESKNLKIKKIKLYPGLGNILNGEIEIRRTVIYESEFYYDYKKLKWLIDNINNYFKSIIDVPFFLTFKTVEIKKTSGVFIYKPNLKVKISELNSRLIIKNQPEISLLSNIKLISSEYANFNLNLKASFKIKANEIIFNELKFFDIDSLVKSEGRLNYSEFLGEFFLSGKIFFKSLLRIFGIKGSDSGELNMDGKIELIEGKDWLDKFYIKLSFDGSFLLEELMQILRVSEKLMGFTQISKGVIEGTVSDFQVKSKIFLSNGNILGVKVDKVSTEALYRKGILQFKEANINLYGGSANAHVWITLPVVVEHYALIHVNSISSNGIFELINWNPEIPEGEVGGWLKSQGKVFSPEASFIYIKRATGIDDLRGKIRWIRGSFNAIDNIYRFSSLEIEMDKTLTSAVGYFDANKNYMNFNFQAKSTDINELIMPYQRGIYGDVIINGNLAGKSDNPEIKINFFSNKLKFHLEEIDKSFSHQSLNFNDINGNIFYTKERLNTHINGGNLSIKGNIFFTKAKKLFEFKSPLYDLDFSFRNLKVEKLYIKAFNDEIKTSLNISGYIKDDGLISSDIIINPIFLGRSKIADKAIVKIHFHEKSFYIKKADFYLYGQSLHAEGYLNFNGALNISGYSKIYEITHFAEIFTKKLGMNYLALISLNNLNFKIDGSINNPIIQANTDLVLRSRSGKIVNGNAEMNYDSDIFSIKANFLKTIQFIAEGIPKNNRWSINCNLSSSRVDPILSMFINNLPEDMVVLIDGKLKGSLESENIDAQINFKKVFVKMYGIGLNNRDLVNIDIKKGNIYFEPIKLIGQSTELTIKGKIVDYFDILVEGNSDLRPFKALLKADELRGSSSLQVYIYGERNNPEITGEVDINDASISIKKDIPSFNNVNAVISFNEDRILIEKANGNFSQGSFSLEGIVYFQNFVIKQLALSGNFSDVRWIFSPRFWAYLDGQVYLTGDHDKSVLSGNVNIKRGIYNERLEWTKLALKSSPSVTLTPKDSWLNSLRFNLRLLTNNFFINNNLATMNLSSDLLLRGNISEPSFLGWINAKDGWIYFRGNKFDILRLLVQFTESSPTKPYINISARTAINQYNVNLNMNGYIDQFNLMLSSNPPLSEQELLNLLVLGQNGSSLGGFPGASEAASFLTGQMEEVFQERIRGLTGLDIMTVEPSVSKKTGSINPRITVGKRLLDGRMTVTYSTATGTTTEQTIKLEYLVKKGVYLVGTKDETGGLSGAIKFRFEFR